MDVDVRNGQGTLFVAFAYYQKRGDGAMILRNVLQNSFAPGLVVTGFGRATVNVAPTKLPRKDGDLKKVTYY